MHTHTVMQTYALLVYGQPTTRHTFHTFNQQRSTQSRHRHCSVFGHHMVKVKSRPHTALKTTDAFKFKRIRRQQYKRTACLFRVNTPPVFDERRSKQSRHCHCSVFVQHIMRVSLAYDPLLYEYQ